MIFNSVIFLCFLPIVFILYWWLGGEKLKAQNIFLVVVSYFFYGYWDWRFLLLIAVSSLIDYYVSIFIKRAERQTIKKRWLSVSIIVNLGLLAFFKYFNFFADSFVDVFNSLGMRMDYVTLNIILPVGISFYTFQTLSYTLDVYKKKIEPSESLIQFLAYVSFFPQLVAGPIERASNLLPQFHKKRKFDYDIAVDGMRQILWGFFKKVVVADNCAIFVNHTFGNISESTFAELIIGMVFFMFQLYGDFSGYSDIAIGSAKLFGFDLKQNFSFPFFSRDIAEFWRRWHMSLTNWFKDYIYFPLGGSRGNTFTKIRNVLIIYLISGLWHGANWTFVFWGALNALFFIPLILLKKNRNYIEVIKTKYALPSIKDSLLILKTFSLVCFTMLFFRASSIEQGFQYINRLLEFDGFNFGNVNKISSGVILIMLAVEWINRSKNHGLSLGDKHFVIRWSAYLCVFLCILFFGKSSDSFIYFQF